MKDYSAKKKMRKVAKPIIDVFLENRTKKERRDFLREVVGNTSYFGEDESDKIKSFGESLGCYNPFNGKIKIKRKVDDSVYAHELGHAFHRKGSYNSLILASALEYYFYNLDLQKDFGEYDEEVNDRDYHFRLQEFIRPLKFHERIFQGYYEKNFCELGINLGVLAANIEFQKGSKWVGLNFLKMVNEGVSINEAVKKIIPSSP